MKKKIFITGAEGFIGSNLVEKLLELDFRVTCLVLYNSFNNPGWLKEILTKKNKNLKIIYGDIRDTEQMKNVLKNQDIIVNLAALIGIPYSYHTPRSYFETNIFGLMNILEAVNKNKIKKIIHVSTSEVYGSPQYIPIDEKHRYYGQSPYSASKISADQLALSYYNSFGTPVTIIRPFNTFGPRQSLRAIIPTLITQYLNNYNYIKIGSLNTIRDLTYIDDTVDAFIKLILTKKKTSGEVINLGTGYGLSIKSLNQKILKLINIKKKILIDKKRLRPKNSEVDKLIANNNKAIKILKWYPKYDKKNIDIALKKTINWFSKKENIKEYYSNDYII